MLNKFIRAISYQTIGSIALLTTVACSQDPLSSEQATATSSLNDQWETTCLLNPQSEQDSEVGYFRETLSISTFTSSQTIEYFQDPSCAIPVTAEQVANQDQTFFLRKQTQQFAVGYPSGSTMTDLGEGFFLNLQVVAVSIDDRVLSETELQSQAIEMQDLLALFVITDSDQLHIASSAEQRPTTVPNDFFYNRASE